MNIQSQIKDDVVNKVADKINYIIYRPLDKIIEKEIQDDIAEFIDESFLPANIIPVGQSNFINGIMR